MKLVVVFVAFLASARSSLEPDIVPHRTCEGMDTVYELGAQCVDATGFTQVLQYKTIEERQEFLKNYCQKQPKILDCLTDVSVTSHSCQNETHHQHFQTYRDLLETVLHAGCIQDGEVFANMVMIYKNDSTIGSNMKYFHQCLATYVDKKYTSLALEISHISRNYILYRDVLNARACFEHIEEGDPRIKIQIVTLLNAIIEKYNCLQPQDNSVVRCNGLNLNGTGTHRVCPIKLMEESERSLYNVLLYDQIPTCFDVSDMHVPQSIDTLTSIEASRSFVKNQCEKVHIIRNNLEEVKVLSWLCLDQPRHLMFETALLFLTNALNRLCAEDGRHLADVILKIISVDANKTSDYDVITECTNVARPPVLDANFTSEKTLEYYQALKVFKECLINKVKDDDVAASSAELLLSGVLNSVKCTNSDLTALVLCETIANTN